jgi:DnaK suppressor protein
LTVVDLPPITEQRAALEALAAEVEAAITAANQDAAPVGLDLAIGRVTRIDALQQQQMALARAERLRTRREQIASALHRLSNGTYGECVRCGEPIAPRRLRARPEAPFCLACEGGRTP